jgi:tRNA (cytidine/uridine-2'-O-)-methyltransferase
VNIAPELNIVLYQPEIPQNTGNVGRSCVAAGAKLWLVRPLGFRLDEKRLRRAGLDYWQHLDHQVVDDWEDLQRKLAPSRTWFFSKTATEGYTDVSYQPGDTLVFGCETGGLPASLLADSSSRSLRIPMRQQVRSLNLASAVAVATFEVLRQWRAGGLIPADFPVQ